MSAAKYLPTHDLYADQLLSLKLGYALYEPDPGEGQDEVHVGDVGYVLHGRFNRLSNVFSSEPGYPAVDDRFHDVEAFANLDEGVMSSECVMSERFEIGAVGSESSSVDVGLMMSCSSNYGATLITKYRANVERSSFPDVLKEHFLKYSHSWLADAQRQGKPTEYLHDLILVTGRVMTGDWATIAFNGRSQGDGASFNNKAISVTSSGTVWGRWSGPANLAKRHGPLRRAPSVDGEEPSLNQCVFLETFRVFDRPWYSRLKSSISLKRKDGPMTKQTSVGKITNALAEQIQQKIFDPKISSAEEGTLNEMPEVVSAYQALAFRAFEAAEVELDLICIDEEDVKRLSSDFGTFSVFSEELEGSDEELIVERFESRGEPEGLKVGRIGRSMETLLHLFASGGVFAIEELDETSPATEKISSEIMELIKDANSGGLVDEDSLETRLASAHPRLLSDLFKSMSMSTQAGRENMDPQSITSERPDIRDRATCHKCGRNQAVNEEFAKGDVRCSYCSSSARVVDVKNKVDLDSRPALNTSSSASV